MKRAFRSIDGWIDLRDYDQACEELHNLPHDWKATTAYAKAWIRIYEPKKKWAEVEALATTLNEAKPDDLFGINKLAEAFFQQGRYHNAIAKLGEALSRENGDQYPLVRYNLARYFTAVRLFKEAGVHLQAAIALDKKLKTRALEDPDLKEFWLQNQMKLD